MKACPETGIGLVYLQGMDTLLEPLFPLIHTIELEPQTLWYSQGEGGSFLSDLSQEELLRSWNLPILFHGVGYPIGGSQLPSPEHFDTLNAQAQRLKPRWMSEHLSFNRFESKGNQFNTNFLLPPLQTEAGLETARCGIRHYIEKTKRPFAFETGANYLRPLAFEMPDGIFVQRLAETADCDILLDLHNLYANEKNGRQSIKDFVRQLPLDRIREIHIANGFEYKGYYLDAHSGLSSPELMELLQWLVWQLPALKAIIFEMLPDYASQVTVQGLKQQLEQMNRIWEQRGKLHKNAKSHIGSGSSQADSYRLTPEFEITTAPPTETISKQQWEETLGQLSIGQTPAPGFLNAALCKDPGIEIIRDLCFHFRASMLVSALKYSTRLLQLKLGEQAFDELLHQFFQNVPPELFPYPQAIQFSDYLQTRSLKIPYLPEVLHFETASLQTMIDQQTRSIEFPYNPFPVFRALAQAQWPEDQDRDMHFILDIRPDADLNPQEVLGFQGVYHN